MMRSFDPEVAFSTSAIFRKTTGIMDDIAPTREVFGMVRVTRGRSALVLQVQAVAEKAGSDRTAVVASAVLLEAECDGKPALEALAEGEALWLLRPDEADEIRRLVLRELDRLEWDGIPRPAVLKCLTPVSELGPGENAPREGACGRRASFVRGPCLYRCEAGHEFSEPPLRAATGRTQT